VFASTSLLSQAFTRLARPNFVIQAKNCGRRVAQVVKAEGGKLRLIAKPVIFSQQVAGFKHGADARCEDHPRLTPGVSGKPAFLLLARSMCERL
jgi:hypothetical protein